VVVARVLVATLALVVFAGTGFGWSRLHQLSGSFGRADVISPAAGDQTGGPAEDQNILLAGLDTRTDAQGNRLPAALLDQLHAGGSDSGGDSSDTIIVVHIPAGGAAATAFSIPRDSYVELAQGFGEHKINSAYSYGRQAALADSGSRSVGPEQERDAAQAGAKTLIQTVQDLTGLSITHYAALNLVGFYRLSEAVGGVPVCLRHAVYDSYTGLRLPAGPSTIQGAQALGFVRQRHGLPRGDLDRIRRQQVFLAALAHKMLSAGVLADPGALDRLTGALNTSVTVDSGFDPLSLARQLGGLTAGRISFVTIPVISEALRTSDGDAVEVDPDQVRDFVSATLSGAPPPATGTHSDPIDRTSTTTGDSDSSGSSDSSGPDGSDSAGDSGDSTSTSTNTTSAAPPPPPITAADQSCIN
jgi:LCP family protein required for cell wall assembly